MSRGGSKVLQLSSIELKQGFPNHLCETCVNPPFSPLLNPLLTTTCSHSTIKNRDLNVMLQVKAISNLVSMGNGLNPAVRNVTETLHSFDIASERSVNVILNPADYFTIESPHRPLTAT